MENDTDSKELMQNEGDKAQLDALKSAIQEGSDSGIAINFDPVTHLENLKLLMVKSR